jgi:hypothetical protein
MYGNDDMIKEMTTKQMCEKLLQNTEQYGHVSEFDYTAFDSC